MEEERFDRLDQKIDNLGKKIDQTNETLTEFIEFVRDDVAMKSDITQAVAQSEHNMKVYIDDKLADQTAELGGRINGVVGKQSKFNVELVDGLESNKVFEADRIDRLKVLTASTASK